MAWLQTFATALVALFLVQVQAAPTSLGLQTPLSFTTSGCNTKALESKPKDVIKAFQNLTSRLTELAGPTNELNSRNAFLVVANEGPFPVILEGATQVIKSGEEFLGEIEFEKPIKDGKDVDEVLEAYTAATKAALFWANILSSKSNGFKGNPIYKPIGALGESILRGVFNTFEDFGFVVTDYLPDKLADVEQQAAALGNGFNQAINQYSQIKLGVI